MEGDFREWNDDRRNTYLIVDIVLHQKIYNWFGQPRAMVMPCNHLQAQVSHTISPRRVNESYRRADKAVTVSFTGPAVMYESESRFECLKKWAKRCQSEDGTWETDEKTTYLELFEYIWFQGPVNLSGFGSNPFATVQLSISTKVPYHSPQNRVFNPVPRKCVSNQPRASHLVERDVVELGGGGCGYKPIKRAHLGLLSEPPLRHREWNTQALVFSGLESSRTAFVRSADSSVSIAVRPEVTC